jgi:transcriptional regulator with XRE-family HTH domain
MARLPVTSFEFARAFGDALAAFLVEKNISQNQAAQALGIGRAKLNTYCHDTKKKNGGRCKPDAEFLYQVCVRLGFQFDYNGFKISASTFDGQPQKQIDRATEQYTLDFERQFYLTGDTGTVTVSLKRPAGWVEMSVSLKATS